MKQLEDKSVLTDMKTSLINRFNTIRNRTERICEPLATEDYVVQPIVDVSPPKWHLGHTSWFFENFILKDFLPNYQLFHPDFNYVFNSYYESVGARVVRTDRGNLSRPTTAEVYNYRKYVNQQMNDLFKKAELITDEVITILELGLNHEEQHQELLVYDIKYILGNNPLFPKYKDEIQVENTSAAPLEFLEIKEGLYDIGYEGKGFHFDNEEGLHKVYLNPAAIANRLVTNAEFLEFIKDGAYSNFNYWLSEAWEWVNQYQINLPLYWHQIDGKWMNFQLDGLKPIDWSLPVMHISFFEADAFAKWKASKPNGKGIRLPTEFEWEVAAKSFGEAQAQFFMEESQLTPQIENKTNFLGNLWEWTESAYRPYPNYSPPKGALGEYNGKFMINQMVLRGGSAATPIQHFRPTYRNFFHPHLRWMFSGFRLAKSL